MRARLGVLIAITGCAPSKAPPAAPPAAAPPALTLTGAAEVVGRGVVSTPATEVKIALSPDGKRALWGVIGWDGGAGGWDIVESERQGDTWSPPRPVSFDSPANDFDPAFAPDGRAVYFFSNRPGGLGGDDLYAVPIDATGGYGAAVNLGAGVNSAGDEWAPVPSPDGGALLFASDGRGGLGGHDLFVATRRGDAWVDAANLGAPVNGPRDDFDAAYLDGDAIVFSSGINDDDAPDVKLYLTRRGRGGWTAPEALPAAINCSTLLNIGPAIDPAHPGTLYWSAYCPERGVGRMDVFRIGYRLSPAT